MIDLAIDIGGTYIKYALINKENQIIKKWKKETKLFDKKDDFYDYLCQDLPLENIEYVGISAPGVLSPESDVLSKAAPHVRIMYHTNVNEEVKKRIHKKVKTINDAKSAGYCEFSIGNAVGTKSSAYFIIGTGIGGCLCDEHGIIHGHDNIAGEFSHLPVGYRQDIPDKTLGLSYLASMSALIDIYNENLEQHLHLHLGQDICQLYLQGDEHAKKAIDHWCRNIIMGLYMIIIIYNPEIICIGGGISQEDWFIDKIKTMMKEEIQHSLNGLITTKIERCKYDNDANLLGAIMYARSEQ